MFDYIEVDDAQEIGLPISTATASSVLFSALRVGRSAQRALTDFLEGGFEVAKLLRAQFREHSSHLTPGFEVAGIVKEVGKGVGVKTGDSVAAITLAVGGYASHVVIPAATAISFPNELDPALATAVLVQGLTAYILLDQARVKNEVLS